MKVEQEVQIWRHLNVAGRMVLDGGAHVGYATEIFLQERAQKVLAVEPDPANAERWRQRVRDPRASLFQGALVAGPEGTVALYKGKGPLADQCHSVVAIDDRECIRVNAARFSTLAAGFDVVKLDIEAGEYALLMDDLPGSVRAIGIELHVRRPEWRAQAPWVHKSLERQGFKWVIPPPENHPRSKWGYEIVAER